MMFDANTRGVFATPHCSAADISPRLLNVSSIDLNILAIKKSTVSPGKIVVFGVYRERAVNLSDRKTQACFRVLAHRVL